MRRRRLLLLGAAGVLSWTVAATGPAATAEPVTPLSINVVGNGTVIASGNQRVSCVAGSRKRCSLTLSVHRGTRVVIRAVPGWASTFGRWSGGCEGNSSTCSLKVTHAERVVASFAAIRRVDDSTHAYYNDSLGTTLDNRANGFPLSNMSSGDPNWFPAPAPTFTTKGAAILGDFLEDPAHLNSYWTLRSIPQAWPVNTETGIVYKLHSTFGLADVKVSLGVDNGVYFWLDGVYRFGAVQPGRGYLGEYTFSLGNLTPGDHYLQILREDHGVRTDWHVSVLVTAAGAIPPFDGFFNPVHMGETNVVNAGQAIPIKFSLGGDYGLDIFATGYPMATQIACDTETVDNPIVVDPIDTAGASTLQYDPTTSTYTEVWKTEMGWGGKCFQLDVKLMDDTDVHSATFRFR